MDYSASDQGRQDNVDMPTVDIPTLVQRRSADVVPTSVCRPSVQRGHTDVVATVDIDDGTTSVCRRWHDVGYADGQ